MERVCLITNASYWAFFDVEDLKEQEFWADTKNIFSSDYDTNKMAINLASALKLKDMNNHAIYGIEIKTNGSSRSSRIPLVRYTKDNQIIFKIIRNLKEVDDGINYLKKLVHELELSCGKKVLPLPSIGLVILSDEKDYVNNDVLKKYVIEKVNKNKVIWFSVTFLETLFAATGKKELDKLLEGNTKIYTNEMI
jgi:hypothetical protein